MLREGRTRSLRVTCVGASGVTISPAFCLEFKAARVSRIVRRHPSSFPTFITPHQKCSTLVGSTHLVQEQRARRADSAGPSDPLCGTSPPDGVVNSDSHALSQASSTSSLCMTERLAHMDLHATVEEMRLGLWVQTNNETACNGAEAF